MTWSERSAPLAPRAVVAAGAAGRALARRLLARDDAALHCLRGVAGKSVLALLGEADALPWADGAIYLGCDESAGAPALFLPTTRAPGVPLPLFERALRAQYPDLAPPLAVLPFTPPCVLSLGAARTVARAALRSWLAEAEG